MSKSYRIVLAACLICLMAGSALASGKGEAMPHNFIRSGAPAQETGRALEVLTFDFGADPIDYIAAGVIFGDQGILPEGSTLVGFGFEDLMVEIYYNDGANFSNWASEAWLGCTFDDPGAGLSYVGISPFAGINEGPGVFGPVSNFFALDPADWPVPVADPFTFFAQALWDDNTGLPAGTFSSGTVYVHIEVDDVVATSAASLTAVKGLFQ